MVNVRMRMGKWLERKIKEVVAVKLKCSFSS